MSEQPQPYSPDPRTMVSPQQGTRVLKFTWAAMALAMGIVYIVPLDLSIDAGGAAGYVFPVALALTALVVLVQLLLGRNLTDDKLFPRLLDLDSWSLPEERKAALKGLRVPDRGTSLIVMAHFFHSLIIWALADAVAILGRVVGVLTADRGKVDALFVVAALSLLYFVPRAGTLTGQARRWRQRAEAGRG